MQEAQKICIITGGNSGIGKATAIELAKMNYKILLLVRDSEKSRQALDAIRSESTGGDIQQFYVDLSSLDSIREVAAEISKQYSHIDILINNAGVLKRKPELSVDGIEMTHAVNLIAPFMLTNLLIPLIKKSKAGRIINLTSELYKKGKIEFDSITTVEKFNGSNAYANSKLMVVVNTLALANKLQDSNVTVNCVHPGVVGTDVMRDYPTWFNKILNLFISKPAIGAQPSVFLASSTDLENTSGKYYYEMTPKPVVDVASNADSASQVWEYCEKVTA